MYKIGWGPRRVSFGVVNMISLTYLLLFVFSSAYSAVVEPVREEVTTLPPASEDVANKELTDAEYRIEDASYLYPLRIVPFLRDTQPEQRNPTETNEIENEDDKRRPLFIFTTYEVTNMSDPQTLPISRPYIEIRRKRDVETTEVPESSKVGKLRRKRTYCGKCGGGYGGYGGYYIPVTYAVYPVYYGGYGGGGRGKGCNTCGYGGGGGGGGSYSYSSSSAQSSSGSFGWGKK